MVQLKAAHICKNSPLHSCSTELQGLRRSSCHRFHRPASRVLRVTAFTGRQKRDQPKSDVKPLKSQPKCRVSPSQAKSSTLHPQMLARQPSLVAPMNAFLQRLGWSLQRVIPDRGLRKTLSSRRLSASSYIFANIHRKSKQARSMSTTLPPAALPGLKESKSQRPAAPTKLQPNSRGKAVTRSTAQPSLPLDDSSLLPAEPKSSALPFLTEATGAALDGWHKPVGLVLVSAHTLATTCHLSGAVVTPIWLPAVTGGAIGLLFAALNRAGLRRFWRAPAAPLNVVVTGSSRGIGKAIAREFLRQGDRVFITSRNPTGLKKVTDQLKEELQDCMGDDVPVSGFGECNVGSAKSVARLAAMAQQEMGTVDVWINNAGYSGTFQSFLDATPEQLTQVVGTNLGGSLLCMRAALKLMAGQDRGGHIFTMDGAGADGQATPQYAAYGATKAGIRQLMRSLAAELRQPLAIGGAYPQPPTAGQLPPPGRTGSVGIHTISPGMVLTNLLLEGSTFANRQVFNILCEQPETVAAFLVPRIRTVVARNEAQRYIRYLTVWSALTRFITAPLRAQRFFDADGEPVYGKEAERITARASKRLAERVAVRSRSLALAYSSSLAASYLLILAHSLAVLPHAP